MLFDEKKGIDMSVLCKSCFAANKQITAIFILSIYTCEKSACYFLDVITYKPYQKHWSDKKKMFFPNYLLLFLYLFPV